MKTPLLTFAAALFSSIAPLASAEDLTKIVVGTYKGKLDLKNESESVSVSDPHSLTVNKESDTKVLIVVFKGHDFWADLTLTATMSSASEFKVDKATWEGISFDGTGSLDGDKLTITFANGGIGTFKGSK